MGRGNGEERKHELKKRAEKKEEKIQKGINNVTN